MTNYDPKFNNDELIILKMLSLAFIDIRAAGTLKKAQIIADIYHNAPSAISVGMPSTEILSTIRQKAERQGALKYVENIEDHVRGLLT